MPIVILTLVSNPLNVHNRWEPQLILMPIVILTLILTLLLTLTHPHTPAPSLAETPALALTIPCLRELEAECDYIAEVGARTNP